MSVSRRGFLSAAGGMGAMLALAACGGEQPATPKGGASPAAAGPWTFTDDRGRKVELPARPTRVVAQVSAAATLWDFGVRPIAVFGPHKLKDGTKDPEAGDIDITKVETIGNVWDEFNIEKYISVQPELLVAGMYRNDELWYVPAKSAKDIEQVAPTIGVQQQGKSGDELIRRYEELAVALGADRAAPLVTQARQRFETAQAALAAAVKETPRKVLFCGASPDLFWVCNPGEFPDQKYFKARGLDIVLPDKVDEGGYFESLSWENIDKYEADAIFVDARAQSMPVADIAKKPTWAKLPAVKAGHVYPWRAETRFTYQGYAAQLEELVANLRKVTPN